MHPYSGISSPYGVKPGPSSTATRPTCSLPFQPGSITSANMAMNPTANSAQLSHSQPHSATTSSLPLSITTSYIAHQHHKTQRNQSLFNPQQQALFNTLTQNPSVNPIQSPPQSSPGLGHSPASAGTSPTPHGVLPHAMTPPTLSHTSFSLTQTPPHAPPTNNIAMVHPTGIAAALNSTPLHPTMKTNNFSFQGTTPPKPTALPVSPNQIMSGVANVANTSFQFHNFGTPGSTHSPSTTVSLSGLTLTGSTHTAASLQQHCNLEGNPPNNPQNHSNMSNIPQNAQKSQQYLSNNTPLSSIQQFPYALYPIPQQTNENMPLPILNLTQSSGVPSRVNSPATSTHGSSLSGVTPIGMINNSSLTIAQNTSLSYHNNDSSTILSQNSVHNASNHTTFPISSSSRTFSGTQLYRSPLVSLKGISSPKTNNTIPHLPVLQKVPSIPGPIIEARVSSPPPSSHLSGRKSEASTPQRTPPNFAGTPSCDIISSFSMLQITPGQPPHQQHLHQHQLQQFQRASFLSQPQQPILSSALSSNSLLSVQSANFEHEHHHQVTSHRHTISPFPMSDPPHPDLPASPVPLSFPMDSHPTDEILTTSHHVVDEYPSNIKDNPDGYVFRAPNGFTYVISIRHTTHKAEIIYILDSLIDALLTNQSIPTRPSAVVTINPPTLNFYTSYTTAQTMICTDQTNKTDQLSQYPVLPIMTPQITQMNSGHSKIDPGNISTNIAIIHPPSAISITDIPSLTDSPSLSSYSFHSSLPQPDMSRVKKMLDLQTNNQLMVMATPHNAIQASTSHRSSRSFSIQPSPGVSQNKKGNPSSIPKTSLGPKDTPCVRSELISATLEGLDAFQQAHYHNAIAAATNEKKQFMLVGITNDIGPNGRQCGVSLVGNPSHHREFTADEHSILYEIVINLGIDHTIKFRAARERLAYELTLLSPNSPLTEQQIRRWLLHLNTKLKELAEGKKFKETKLTTRFGEVVHQQKHIRFIAKLRLSNIINLPNNIVILPNNLMNGNIFLPPSNLRLDLLAYFSPQSTIITKTPSHTGPDDTTPQQQMVIYSDTYNNIISYDYDYFSNQQIDDHGQPLTNPTCHLILLLISQNFLLSPDLLQKVTAIDGLYTNPLSNEPTDPETLAKIKQILDNDNLLHAYHMFKTQYTLFNQYISALGYDRSQSDPLDGEGMTDDLLSMDTGQNITQPAPVSKRSVRQATLQIQPTDSSTQYDFVPVMHKSTRSTRNRTKQNHHETVFDQEPPASPVRGRAKSKRDAIAYKPLPFTANREKPKKTTKKEKQVENVDQEVQLVQYPNDALPALPHQLINSRLAQPKVPVVINSSSTGVSYQTLQNQLPHATTQLPQTQFVSLHQYPQQQQQQQQPQQQQQQQQQRLLYQQPSFNNISLTASASALRFRGQSAPSNQSVDHQHQQQQPSAFTTASHAKHSQPPALCALPQLYHPLSNQNGHSSLNSQNSHQQLQ